MNPRPVIAVLAIGATFVASIGSAHGQAAAPAPAPQSAPAPAPYPPPAAPQYPPPGPYQQPYPPPQLMYAPPGPRYIKDWEEGQPVPYGYHPEARARKGMVIPGAVVFGVAYLLSTLVAGGDNNSYDSSTGTYRNDQYEALYIPVAGPFIQMASDSNAPGDRQILILDGLAQSAGVALLVCGLAFPRRILVRNDLGVTSVVPTPMTIGRGGTGLGLVARF